LEPAYGYGIAQQMEQMSKAVAKVNQGFLYPALHRLKQTDWLKSNPVVARDGGCEIGVRQRRVALKTC